MKAVFRFTGHGIIAALAGALALGGSALAVGSTPGAGNGVSSEPIVVKGTSPYTFQLTPTKGMPITYQAHLSFPSGAKIGGSFVYPSGCSGPVSGTTSSFKVAWHSPCAGEQTTFTVTGTFNKTGKTSGKYADNKTDPKTGTWVSCPGNHSHC